MAKSKPRVKTRAGVRVAASRPKFTKRREVRVIAGAVLAFAAVMAIGVLKQKSLWVSEERLVTVYRIRGCTCAFRWKKVLEGAGFSVQMRELRSLQYIRKTMRTPATAHGCHTGAYLGYFIEGHISPTALHKLAQSRPSALGIGTETSMASTSSSVSVEEDERSLVLLVSASGDRTIW